METRLTKSKSQLQITLSKMQESQKTKNYLKAHSYKLQIEKISKQIAQLQKRSVKNRQKFDLKSMEAMHQEEMIIFSQKWAHELKQTRQQGEEMRLQMKTKQSEQKRIFDQNFKEQLENQEYHQSGAAISLLKKEQALAKLEKFMEAHEVQVQRLKQEAQQKQMFRNLKKQKHKIDSQKMLKKHEHQLKVLNQKIETRLQEVQKQFQKEKQQLIQKHRNIISDFKTNQKKQNLASSGLIKNTNGKSICSSTGIQRLKSARKITSPFKQNQNTMTQ